MRSASLSISLLILLAIAFGQSGCYYGHLASGQLKILWKRQPIEEARLDPSHPEDVRALLGLVESVRQFAIDLGLRVDGQYTSYVDWPDDRIVTTLVRTRVGEIEAVPWWFPVVGHLPYKGYFDRARAEAEAKQIRAKGEYDLCVSGVTAYSTLGWLDDPVTRPMLTRGPTSLVETLFHELVHATAFLPGEADFNEGVAQFIGQQAAIQFFAAHALPPYPQAAPANASVVKSASMTTGLSLMESASMTPGQSIVEPASVATEAGRGLDPSEPSPRIPPRWPSASRVRASIQDRAAIATSILRFRDRLAAFEGSPGRETLRAMAEAEARAELAALPLAVFDADRVAEKARLSDACLALRGTYVRDLPRHAAVYEALDQDLPSMIARLSHWVERERPSDEFFDVETPAQDAP